MKPSIHNITVKKGALWPLTLRFKDVNGAAVDLTSYAAKMEMREKPSGVLLATPTVTITAATGTIYFELTHTQTAALGALSGVYDIIVTKPDASKFCPLQGDIEFLELVTQ